MKNKLLVMFLLISVSFFYLASQEKSDNVIKGNSSGFEDFLTKNIGKDISVTINNLDTTISGTLLKVYNDSVIIQTIFNKQVLILKNSIAYIKIGIEKSSK